MADPRDKMRRLWPFAWVDTDDKASWEMQEHETGLYITVDDPALVALIEVDAAAEGLLHAIRARQYTDRFEWEVQYNGAVSRLQAARARVEVLDKPQEDTNG